MPYTQYYCTELLHKVYYFCLKKTGDERGASELSSEISLHILQELNRGVIPNHFHAWVWRIARNRYARWVKNRKTTADRFYSGDIADMENGTRQPLALTNFDDPSEQLLREEELLLLRRELAFIRSDYRNLLVAYYIRGEKIRSIALKQGLSENTVKTRLYNSRKKLKEGMDMARQYGRLSYDPQHISFSYSVYMSGENGEPYSLLERMIPKNLLVELSRGPSTVEELALELGIATPYIEDELRYLLESSLVGKEGNHYVCNIAILNRDVQHAMYARFLKSLASFALAVQHIVEAKKACLRAQERFWTSTVLEEDEQKWMLLAFEFGQLLGSMRRQGENGNELMNDAKRLEESLTKRPNGGIWDMVGKESCPELEPIDYWIGNDAIDESGTTYVLYMDDEQFRRGDITELTAQEDGALNRAITGCSRSGDEELLQRLEQLGYIVQTPSAQAEAPAYLPACLDLDTAVWIEEAGHSEEVNTAYRHALQLYRDYYDYCYQKIAAQTSGNQSINLHFAVSSFVGGLFPMLAAHLLQTRYLKYSNHKMAGVIHLLRR